ncbi:MAG: PKD domain-containing protein [Planctomycetota bacterium]|nr:MAG: PKD domain-containing protein [Planctomycetota bacterium]
MRNIATRLGAGVLVISGLFAATLGGCPVTGTGGATGGVGGAFNLAPIALITADVTTGTVPLTVSFSSSRSSDDGLILSRSWDFGDGATSLDISPRHTFMTIGEFTVTLTVTDDAGAVGTETVVITVTEPPIARISVNDTQAENAPATFRFDATNSVDPDGEIVEFEWDFDDGARETLDVVDHTFATAGTYRVRLTVTDDAGITDEATVLIRVGIRQPSIELRIPPPDVQRLVLTQDAPLWVQGVFEVEPGVQRTIRAGIDGDRDACNALSFRFNVLDAEEQFDFQGHFQPIRGAAFDPEGRRLLSTSDDGTAQIYDAGNGFLISSFDGSGQLDGAAWTPDGASIVYGQSNGAVILRSASNGTIIRTMTSHTAAVRDVAVSPDGSRILSGGADGQAILWSATDGTVLGAFSPGAAVNAVAFHPTDSNQIATGDANGVITLWNVDSGTVVRTITGHTDAVNDIEYSAAGSLLASAGDNRQLFVWNVADGTVRTTFTGHTADVNAVALTTTPARLVSGGDDGVGVWDLDAGTLLAVIRPCASPITALTASPNGADVIASVGAFSDVQLDTDPPNGNDLNITAGAALQLQRVEDLDGADVPTGDYFVWVEIDTDQSEPTRAYANATITVIDALSSTIDADTAKAPLLNDQVTVIVNPDASRQVFDLGPVSAGDRIFLNFVTTPGFGTTKDPLGDYGLMLLDATQDIFAWFQRLGGEDFVLFSPNSKLVIAENTTNLYVVTDGGHSVDVRIQRQTNLNAPRAQRVYVRFDGASDVGVGNQPAINVPPLDAADFNQFFAVSPNWGDAQTATIKTELMKQLRAQYAAYNITFVSSDEVAADPSLAPAPPFQTIYVGGFNLSLFGLADYVDPRNDTAIGSAIVYASRVAQVGATGGFANPADTPATLGFALGNVAAHECGHLLGLRHTDDAGDLMARAGVFDPTATVSIKAAAPTTQEQIDNLPAIGTQNAPRLLEETVGTP